VFPTQSIIIILNSMVILGIEIAMKDVVGVGVAVAAVAVTMLIHT
jgi:hypothetical protein